MPQENCQKIKLLKLMEILRQETDEDHPLKTTAICEKLLAMNIKCDRRTLSGVLSAWFRRLLICHGRMRNTAYSFITSFLGHIRVWDYPNKQNARAL